MNELCHAVYIKSEWSGYEMHVTRSASLCNSVVCIYTYMYTFSKLNGGNILKLKQKQKVTKFSVMALVTSCYLLLYLGLIHTIVLRYEWTIIITVCPTEPLYACAIDMPPIFVLQHTSNSWLIRCFRLDAMWLPAYYIVITSSHWIYFFKHFKPEIHLNSAYKFISCCTENSLPLH